VSIMENVQQRWKRLKKSEQRWMVAESMNAADAEWRMRCKIIRNLVRGETPSTIARVLGCSRSSVYRVADRFLAEGPEGLVDGREDNGEPKVTEELVLTVLVAVAGSPRMYGYQRPTWTQELLVLVVAQETGVRISTTTMSRLLHREGMRCGRPKPVVACPWSKHKKSRCLNAIRRLEASLPPDAVLLYVDEVDVHLNPKIGNDWMLEGQQKTVMTPGQNQKHYLAGALNFRTGRLAFVEGPRKTSALFIQLVDHLVFRAYARATVIHLVLDNFRIHTSKAVQAAQARWGERVQLHFLPPYCPDHNRIERLWRDLHDNVTRNHQHTTMGELMNDVRAYLNQRRRSGKHTLITA
jgi:transposase